MDPDDRNRVSALVHHANVILSSDQPDNFDRESDLVKRSLRLADKLLAGTATEEDRRTASDQVHPSVRSQFGL